MERQKKKRVTKANGITLISLVITVAVIMVLAGATISTLTGENGLINQSNSAKTEKNASEEKEILEWAASQSVAENEIGIIENKENLKTNIDTYIGQKSNSDFDYDIEKLNDVYVVTFSASGNSYTISDNGIIYDGEQQNRDGVNLSQDNITVNVGETVTLNYTSGSTEVTWTSSNSSVASVDNGGNVTGISNGTTVIKVTTEKGKSAQCSVTVQTVPTEVVLSETDVTIDISSEDRTKQLQATIGPETANAQMNITWTSSDSNVATVSSTGLITGISNGTATITATTENGITGTCVVTVVTSSIGLNLNYSAATLDLTTDTTLQLTATSVPDMANVSNTVTWSSNNTSIATVDSNGKVTAIGLPSAKTKGVVEISATTDKGVTAICKIVVIKTISSITLSQTSGTIDLGTSSKTLQLTATINPSDTTESVVWTSSNTNVATVSDTGLITGKSNGTATITVKNSTGKKSATSTITIQTSPTSVSLNQSSLSFKLSDSKTAKLTATIKPSTANVNKDIKWTSSDTSIATVDSSGNVTAVKKGTATITVTTTNNKQATCSVTVTQGSITITSGLDTTDVSKSKGWFSSGSGTSYVIDLYDYDLDETTKIRHYGSISGRKKRGKRFDLYVYLYGSNNNSSWTQLDYDHDYAKQGIPYLGNMYADASIDWTGSGYRYYKITVELGTNWLTSSKASGTIYSKTQD